VASDNRPRRPTDATKAGGSDLRAQTPASSDVAPLRVPTVDACIAAASRLFCDARIARLASSAGVSLLSAVPSEVLTSQWGDPALLTISWAQPRNPPQRVLVTVAVDMEHYVELRIALGHARTIRPDTGSASGHDLKRVPEFEANHSLRHAVASLLVEPLLMRMGELGFPNTQLDRIERGQLTANAWPVVAVTLSVSTDKNLARQHHALLALSPAALATIRDTVAQVPPDMSLSHLRIPGSAVVGIKPIAIDTLQQLKAGDVLLRALLPCFSTSWLSQEQGMQATADFPAHAVAIWSTPTFKHAAVKVTVHNRSLIFNEDPKVSDDLPFETEPAILTGHAENPVPITDFELPVQFEIDTVAMSIGQLSSLRAGYVVELPIPLIDARLRLVAHGQTIGYGELVTVGDHLGVRIIRMAHLPVSDTTEKYGSVQ